MRCKNLYVLKRLRDNYSKILDLCNKGRTLTDAVAIIGISKRKFYYDRYIAELAIVDKDAYDSIMSNSVGVGLQQLNKLCQNKLGESCRLQKVTSFRIRGLLLT